LRYLRFFAPVLALFAFGAAGVVPASASAGGSGVGRNRSSGKTASMPRTGGAGIGAPKMPASTLAHPIVQGMRARIIHGVGYAPSYAPIQVQRVIWAGNKIRHKPYIYAGGHGVWNDAGYDCSGSVSYVLHAAGLLRTSMDSSGFESWGRRGLGQWITVYTNPGHAFIQVAGIRFDTSAEGDPNPPPGTGPRWRPIMHGAPGFLTRHPAAL
jgi:hypothetical protein